MGSESKDVVHDEKPEEPREEEDDKPLTASTDNKINDEVATGDANPLCKENNVKCNDNREDDDVVTNPDPQLMQEEE